MKAKVIKTGEMVDVYHEPQHGQVTNIYKESVLVNGRMWPEDELDFCVEENEAPETYPIQFRDKIDEYLWKEHHILGGCCSSIENMKYTVAREVAEKLTDTFIEKAINFIEMLSYGFTITDNITHTCYDEKQMIEDFRNYIKGE